MDKSDYDGLSYYNGIYLKNNQTCFWKM